MPGAVTQMFEQALDAVKGWPGALHALDKVAPLDSDLLTGLTAVPAGRVAHINAAGDFELGGEGTEMPIFLWEGKDDADVYNNGVSPTTGTTHWIAISPTGKMHGLVATGGFELQTTEFDDELTYATNELLGTDAHVDGILINGMTQYVDWICGVCSTHVGADNQSVGLGVVDAAVGPRGTNAHGVETLTFWSYFLPEAAAQ